ncbi:sensor histidine kinase [Sediminibacillus albus]|uniref:histidine kinase n=1 Tax=Sediminibacillus albus TaxID=407036 RepID=A0A1G8WKT4_9BACI|nr:sensor histidine kinase [Sediminibacillus albus]SDJ78988.1 Signal transduction histidine kinase [Sediminibacillus albus]
MNQYTYWLCLALLMGTWGFGLNNQTQGLTEVTFIQWLGSALFFSVYFLLPLFKRWLLVQSLMLSSASLIVMGVFWPMQPEGANYFTLLLFAYLAGEMVYRLPVAYAYSVGGAILSGLLLPAFLGSGRYFPISFLLLYISILGLALWKFHHYFHQSIEVSARYNALLHEYRGMKRNSILAEKLARQQERTLVGREIHDSVGHKLTNLLMQLEVTRMKADEPEKQRIGVLKDLAKESLEETRRAVKALKQEEIGGIPAIISLIRKLEAENFIRIHFSVKNRAFSVQLLPEQTVAVYRAVQEALTNVMRHSPAREASVIFESPGESIFRFEVSNPIKKDYTYSEGFGLNSMRERVDQAGGSLDILVYKRLFIVRGTFPLHRKDGGINGSDIVG